MTETIETMLITIQETGKILDSSLSTSSVRENIENLPETLSVTHLNQIFSKLDKFLIIL